jgi:hypothetical protein
MLQPNVFPLMAAAVPDFIEVYESLLDPATCAMICRRFDASPHGDGVVGSGLYPDLKKSRDLQITGLSEWNEVVAKLLEAVLKALLRYLRTYPHVVVAPLMLEHHPEDGSPSRRLSSEDVAQLDDNSLLMIVEQVLRPGSINLQRYTADEGGYPYWHCELYPQDAASESLHRLLLWTVYLNDDFSEGETEFLYQHKRVKPMLGSVLIAPTAFTHTHRGNMPKGGDKYIATSWILFQRAESIGLTTPAP